MCQWVYKFDYNIQQTEKKEQQWVYCLYIKQKNPRPKGYTVRGLQNAETHLYDDDTPNGRVRTRQWERMRAQPNGASVPSQIGTIVLTIVTHVPCGTCVPRDLVSPR